MWPFNKASKLPGVEQQPNGQISFTLTAEEQAEVDSFFRLMKESSQETEKGTWYIHPDAQKAMTARALIGYAQSQVASAEIVDGVLPKDDPKSGLGNRL
jgi:hypothetical protein